MSQLKSQKLKVNLEITQVSIKKILTVENQFNQFSFVALTIITNRNQQ